MSFTIINNKEIIERISPENFQDFTYSKKWHFDLFKKKNYDRELFGDNIDPADCDLKTYQDLLTFAFIKQNIKEGSKILEIGGGQSRVLDYFKDKHECWNIDKLEGFGNGPTEIQSNGVRLICDYMGTYNDNLPQNYFDFVFSISALEHTGIHHDVMYQNILNDINRVLKQGCYSMHSIDQCVDDINDFPGVKDEEFEVWVNPIIEYFFNHEKTINKFVNFLVMMRDPDLYAMSEKYYTKKWMKVTNKSYKDFGMPVSVNFLWRKQ